MHHLSRLDKAFLRKGIQLSRANNIVSLSCPSGASVRVLLPDELPLEEKAVTQLLDFAEVKIPDHPGYVRQTCATPDFHPGNGVPVGAVVASTPDLVIPAAIGTDISCGMRLLTTGLTLEQAEANKDVIAQRLTQVLLQNERDVPLSAQAFTALLMTDRQSACQPCHQQVSGHARISPEWYKRLTAALGLTSITVIRVMPHPPCW